MADRVDCLQQMADLVGHIGKDGFTGEEIQGMPGSGFLRTRWRITGCLCPSKEMKGHIAYRIRPLCIRVYLLQDNRCISQVGMAIQ